MSNINKKIEERITMEIVVDAYNDEERAMGWYYYADEYLSFPFKAKCIKKRAISPLKINQKVDVIDIANANECNHELFVVIAYNDDELAVPLVQLRIVEDDPKGKQVIDDWYYWVSQGYSF